MHAPIHLALSWLVAHHLPELRDRRLVTWAGVVPDVDALSLLGGVGAYVEYHHVLTHGVLAATTVTAACAFFARNRLRVALLSLVAFHLHLLRLREVPVVEPDAEHVPAWRSTDRFPTPVAWSVRPGDD